MKKERLLKRLPWLLGVVALVLLATGTAGMAGWLDEWFPNEPLTIKSRTKDIGQVKAGEDFETVFRFRNRQDKWIQIVGNNGS
jgi:hypothetical protein